MEAKEKAKDLVSKFESHGVLIPWTAYLQQHSVAKQCALIAVDEVLLACALETKGKFEYYLEVKKEIEKL